ncbi:MAG: pyridoxine 5'-phosphate synthase [Dokdonella sp.]|uniref:pyridoxine 5'-phosphate synthase n=1 Tax=Dokdonella sp. TaxID=2291710 RepID=UPI003BB09B6D
MVNCFGGRFVVTLLSVNVNKVAVLRNSRGAEEPRPLTAAACALAAGCHGITVHPRPDQRHIRATDVLQIAGIVGQAELNLEGNPFAAARDEYPGLLQLVRQSRAAQVTLVPDADAQITSDHGFDRDTDFPRLQAMIREYKACGARTSVFVDPGCTVIAELAGCGVDRIEIYTGPFALAYASGAFERELDACVVTADRARECGLGVNAGHDLSQANLATLLQAIPTLAEVSIGHALFAEALYAGLGVTVRNYLDIIRRCASAPGAGGARQSA